MSNYKYEGYGVIRDLKDDILYHTDDIVDLLEEKDIHIKKLEEENQQLKQTQEQQVREKVVEDIRNQLKNMDFLASDWELGERCTCYSKYKVLDILLKVEKDQVKGENNVKD